MKTKRTIFIPFIVVITLVVVIASIHFSIQGWLNRQLPELLNKNPNRKYTITYSKARLDLWEQNLLISSVDITEQTDSAKPSTIKIEQFKVFHLQLKKLFINKEIVTKDLSVVNPVFNVITRPDNSNRDEEKINEIWTDVFTRLSIKNLEIKNALVKLTNEQDSLPELKLERLNMKIGGFSVDTTTLKNPLPIHFNDLWAHWSNTEINIDTIGLLRIQNTTLTDHSIQLKKSSFEPRLSKYEFINLSRDKDDWISFDMDQLTLNNFSWSFDTSGVPLIKAASFQLDSMVLHSLKDKRFANEHKGYKPLLSELFRSLPLKFQLDSFRIVNSAAYAETRPINNDTTGIAVFDNLYASGYNLHNSSKLMLETEFDLLCRFMNDATLKAHYAMDVNDKENRFRLTGSLNNLTAESVNKILQPLADINTAGQLYGIDFYLLADSKQSTGTVDFEYDHLKIQINNKSENKKNIWLSALSNLALRSSNVRSDRNFRQGEIQFTRDTDKAIFGYIWDSVKNGLMNTLVPFDMEQKRSIFKRKKR